MIDRLLRCAITRSAAKHPVNTGPTSGTQWPHTTRWQRLVAPWVGRACPDCGVAAMTRHRDGCTTGSWDGGTWA